MKWKSSYIEKLTNNSLNMVFNNEIPAIVVKDFFPLDSCKKLLMFLEEKNLIESYDYNFDKEDAPEALHYMTTHYLFEEDTNSNKYFIEAQDSIKKYQEICLSLSIDPMDKISEAFQKAEFQFTPARQENQNYSQCMIRSLKEGALLHADFAPFLKQDWTIKNITQELAWNIFVTTPLDGGECCVYNRPWQKEDDKFIKAGTYGYDKVVVKNAESYNYKPSAGDLVIFNSRNFHEVVPSSGNIDRITIGGHFGRHADSPNLALSWV